MKEKPLLSVVTVVFNGARYLEQAIQSVLNQAYDNIEYIVIDGGSTDGSVDIIRRYDGKIAYWVSEPDKGIFDAMNKGIKKASGDFIGILNADDWYEPGIIQRVAEEAGKIDNLRARPGQVVFYCDYYHYDEELSVDSKVKRYSTMEYWKGMTVSHQSMFIGREIYERLGNYDLTYRLAADYDFLLRMIRDGVEFVKIDIHGVNFRRGGESTMRMKESLREASQINRQYFGLMSKKHLTFILNNHIPSLLGRLKLISYKYLGREKTARLRRLWKNIKTKVFGGAGTFFQKGSCPPEAFFSIITPSYNMLSSLKNCAASIRDQEGVDFEHIVIDGASADGTAAWLGENPQIKSVSEKDNGMYDAINKGLKMAGGDIVAYLNCDEQYLPGTLAFVNEWFAKHPEVDLIFGDTLLIRPDGSLIAFRKGYRPRWYYIAASHLYLQSCSMFFRRRIIDDGCFFDTRFRVIGDEEFVVRLLRAGYKASHVGKFLAAFTMTGKNLSVDERAVAEKKMAALKVPGYIRRFKWVINGIRFAEKFLSGAYLLSKPLIYQVYSVENETANETENETENETRRKTFVIKKASSKWRWQ